MSEARLGPSLGVEFLKDFKPNRYNSGDMSVAKLKQHVVTLYEAQTCANTTMTNAAIEAMDTVEWLINELPKYTRQTASFAIPLTITPAIPLGMPKPGPGAGLFTLLGALDGLKAVDDAAHVINGILYTVDVFVSRHLGRKTQLGVQAAGVKYFGKPKTKVATQECLEDNRLYSTSPYRDRQQRASGRPDRAVGDRTYPP